MLTVVLIWLYVITVTYILGFGFLKSFVGWPGMTYGKKGEKSVKRYDIRFRESYIVAGIVILTVYAQIMSLFAGVGLIANILIIAFCVLVAVYYRDELISDGIDMFYVLRSKGNIFIYLIIFLIMAYGTSHGIMHYDSDLYHAQAIHWIEKYGIVKGLGNLHVRLAYNSSAFPLTALFSMSFVNGQSYHVMAGFFALLLAWQCLDIKNVYRRGHFVLSDFARLAAIYYLFTIYDEMVSPASDYFLSVIVFYTIIHWLDMYIKHEKSYVPYILLALLGIYAITIKLSAAPMILLSVIPIVKLFYKRNKEKMKAFGISVGLALFIVVPFLIRNVIISGWILYPVTILDFFGFSWEIPKGVAEFDALEIKTFGRGFNDVASYSNVTMREWVPGWFEQMAAINKLMLLLSAVSIVIYIAYVIYFIVAVCIRKSRKINARAKVFDISKRSVLSIADFLTVGATLVGCLIFWFFSAPLIRYGVVYVWLTPMVILGRLVIAVCGKLPHSAREITIKFISACFVVWLIYKGVNLYMEDNVRFNAQYLVKQQDYGDYETKEFEMGGNVFYYPAEGDQIGYYPFPASTNDITGTVEMIGTKIKDGFKSKSL